MVMWPPARDRLGGDAAEIERGTAPGIPDCHRHPGGERDSLVLGTPDRCVSLRHTHIHSQRERESSTSVGYRFSAVVP